MQEQGSEPKLTFDQIISLVNRWKHGMKLGIAPIARNCKSSHWQQPFQVTSIIIVIIIIVFIIVKIETGITSITIRSMAASEIRIPLRSRSPSGRGSGFVVDNYPAE